MNFIEILKKAFMDNWTGGASGEPNRYHGRGAFEDFNLGDMLRQNRWITEESDRNPKSERPEYTSYYHPRLTGESMRSFIEDQRSDPRTFPMGNGPMVTDSGLQRGFQDWPGVNPQGRPYDINPNPEGRNPDNPAHRYHPGAAGAYNPAAGQAARAVHRPPGVRINPDARSVIPHSRPSVTEFFDRGGRQPWLGASYDEEKQEFIPHNDAPIYGGRMSGDTTRTIVQNKDGTKETVVTKTPNPETSMTEIMRKIREYEEARAR